MCVCCRLLSCRLLSCRLLSCRLLSFSLLSFSLLSCSLLSCSLLSCSLLSCHHPHVCPPALHALHALHSCWLPAVCDVTCACTAARCFTEVMLRIANPARGLLPWLFKNGKKGE
jgi:hypothetical protein